MSGGSNNYLKGAPTVDRIGKGIRGAPRDALIADSVPPEAYGRAFGFHRMGDTIGAVIGHEISHHFDDQGRKYDPTGKLADWWTPQDVTRFESFTKPLVAQYDSYEPLPGQHIQGGLTLGENIADLAGLTVAYDAYKKSLGGKTAPTIDGTTGDQRFYYGWAQVWRTEFREPALRQQLLRGAVEALWAAGSGKSWMRSIGSNSWRFTVP
mgnify:CR=1 FL=1